MATTDDDRPFEEFAGFVAKRRRGPLLETGKLGWVVIYKSVPQGLDDDDGRLPYHIVCEVHCTLIGVESRRAAMTVMRSGAREFCEDCRDGGAER